MAIYDDARAFLEDQYGPTYDAWLALDPTQALRTLTSSARYLNLLPWMGTFTGTIPLAASTDLVWPRSGVFVDGVEISSLTTPVDVLYAQYELAVLILAKPGIVTLADQGSNIKKVGGGGAPEVEYFVPTSAAFGNASTIPVLIGKYIGKYLASPGAGVDGGFGSPGLACSAFASGRQFKLVGSS